MAMRDSSTTGASVTPAAGVAIEETAQLIAAAKVGGTPVYNRHGDRLGTVDDVMLDKRTGRVAYAVMSFGGFLGIGERYHPLPWSMLNYDVELGGYLVDLDRDRLEGAPSFASNEDMNWADRNFGQRVSDYYGVRPYWAEVP
ncbi:PRC-barrel domain-containing protein [Paeniroseomonas aquatica]|uniref:PRC-barrel domain-containing protein n=1 Tax=Paeniroseomonas aquatica TaxID=373043 RepID=A0ABT8A4L0_9PROT|nr:PRC-barrel domain-containing protein [Paeniroseomonas aquatica]MDN3564728.1 PRC-barrel domain-containing protein [Paeniroseomonas aquatica]